MIPDTGHNVSQQFTFLVTPHTFSMRGDLKRRKLFASVCHPQPSSGLQVVDICITLVILKLHVFNSLAPGGPGCYFNTSIFNLVLLIGFSKSYNDNAPRCMPWDLTDDRSTLVQVMAWCRQATSHYLSQC